MSKEKQIDEIAKLICNFSQCVCYNSIGECANTECQIVDKAETLYNIGYRKQSEGEWEIVKGSHGKEIMICTNCRHSQDLHATFTYCPNCGAKMKGGE